MAAGKTHYTNSKGIIELRDAVSEKILGDKGVHYDPKEEILITPGAKQAIAYVLFTILNPQDEVIIPEPYWLSYRDLVLLAGGKPVTVPTTETMTGWRIGYLATESSLMEETVKTHQHIATCASARVAMIPGIAYGGSGEGYLRLSFTTPIENLNKAVERLKSFEECYE